MNKEDKILKTLAAWLIIFLLCFDVGAVVIIIDILQYSLLTTLPLIIVIVALVISLNASLIAMLVETKNEWN